MIRQNLIRGVAFGGLVTAVLTVGVWRLVDARVEPGGGDAHARPAGSSANAGDDDSDVIVSRGAQQRGGIAAGVLRAGVMRAQTRAYGTVLDPMRLADLANAEASATAQLEAANAKAEASGHAYQRAKLLYKDDQNTSLAQFQAAEAAFRVDQAAVASARSQAAAARAAEASEFGAPLSRSLGHSGVGRSLIERTALLVQVTPSPGASQAAAPTSAALEAPGGRRVMARLIGVAPRVDPKLQAMSYLYVAPAASGLLPGMNVMALLPGATLRRGAIVPASAVVSWQGQSWIYQQTGPELFRRAAIAIDAPTNDGGYMTDALQPGAFVVLRGAQLLLSQELKPRAQGAADGD